MLLVDALVEQAIVALPPDAREAVVVGRSVDAPEHENHLFVVDVDTGSTRRIAPEVTLPVLKWRFPLAVTRNGLSVYFDLPAGDLHRIVAVPIDGAPGVETIIPALTARPLSMDVARDGSIYLDQITQPNEIVRIDPDGEPVERLPLSEGTGLVALPDGRFLVVTQVAGRSQLVEMAPGRDPVPFLDFEEDARPPLALVGNDAAAFVSGALDREHLTLVSHEGRLIRRVPIAAEGYVTGLTSMPDGSTLFYAAGGSVFRIAAEGGTPTLVSRGERVAFDPASGNLVIMRLESSGGTLVRVPPGGGSETPIVPQGDWWATITSSDAQLPGRAVAPDGRILVQVELANSWFWQPGIVDAAGRLMPPIFDSPQDVMWATWDPDGRVVAIAATFQAQLWRFRRGDQTGA